MKREEKSVIVSSLSEKLQQYPHYYLTDISGLNAGQTASLRKLCFEKGVCLVVVKNTLFRLALEENKINDAEIVATLEGPTAVMFANVGNVPARLIKEFRGTGSEKPLLKSAWVQECAYVGEESLSALEHVKSRDELIGDIIGLLQSPAKNVISALQSSGHKLSGVVKTLSERE